jgi:hypothetical protein
MPHYRGTRLLNLFTMKKFMENFERLWFVILMGVLLIILFGILKMS